MIRIRCVALLPILLISVLMFQVGCQTSTRTDKPAPVVLHRDPIVKDMSVGSVSAHREANTSDTETTSVATPAQLDAPLARRVEISGDTEMLAQSSRELPSHLIKDLDLSDMVDVVTLLRVMAKSAGINMLISPDVRGQVSFTFRDIPWDEAFRSVIASSGLSYDWQGNVLRVLTIDDLRRELELETALRDREAVREELRRVEPMLLRVIPVQYLAAARVGDTVRRALTGSVDENPRAADEQSVSVSVDSESNAIIVHAMRDDIEKVIRLIEQLDKPRPLVQIEAKIVEATRDTARQLGMQWGGQSSRLSNGRVIKAGSGTATSGGYAADFPAQFMVGGNATAGFSFGMVSERIGAGELLNLQLSALQQQGRIDINASPTVTVLDNETAVIESGEERAYRVSTGTGNVLEGTLEWKKAVLKLEVMPHVVDGSMLKVDIVAHKDSFDETKPQTNNEFPVNTKRAQTTVMLQNGETTMIGGFSLESNSDTASGVPFLMNLPLLGHLFRNKTTSGRFDETIIFITPTILSQ